MPRLAAISAMMLFATMVGVLLGVRDARRSMTAGYSRLRESVVAVREYVEHVGTPPAAIARVRPARPASTAASSSTSVPTLALAPARSRIAAVSPSIATESTAIATLESAASPGASSFGAAPLIAAQPLAIQPLATQPLAAEPVAAESVAPPIAPIEMPHAMSTVNTVSTVNTLTALASPPPRAAAAAVVGTVGAETRVKQALARYQQAYDTLDARAAAASWPSVDVAALTRAFNNLKSQSLIFDRCTVDVASAAAATASCTGSTTAVRQVGSATPVTRLLHWTFNLRRGSGDTWVIDTVTTSRP